MLYISENRPNAYFSSLNLYLDYGIMGKNMELKLWAFLIYLEEKIKRKKKNIKWVYIKPVRVHYLP